MGIKLRIKGARITLKRDYIIFLLCSFIQLEMIVIKFSAAFFFCLRMIIIVCECTVYHLYLILFIRVAGIN